MSKKLLRLHTTDFNSIFDCVFNEEIKINPYSEIALHSASFPVANRFINIDSTNDTLTYQVQGGISHTINIVNGTYSKHNASRLLEAITNSMNQDLNINNSKEHGTEISVNLNTDTRISFEFGYANQLEVSSSATDSGTFFTNSPRVFIGARGNFELKLKTNADQSQNNDKGYIVGEVPFTRGCGNIIFDLTQYQLGDGSAGDNAITFGLIPQSIYDIYKSVENGDAVASDVSIDKWKFALPLSKLGGASGLTQGSKISMDLSQGKISFREYISGGPTRLLAEVEYDYEDLGTQLYYPALILHLEPQYLKIKNLKFTPSPFNLPATLENVDPTLEATAFGNAPRPSGARPSKYNLIFPAISLRDYLGFSESNLNPLEGTSRDRVGINAFQGQHHFTNMTSSDNYLIEMLNLKLDSYDSFSPNNVGGGRKNILAPIPVSEQIIDNQTGLVQYEPNTFNFISINNEYALNLRNIRLRIIDFQHQPILNNGFQNINIIIRDTDKTKEAMQ